MTEADGTDEPTVPPIEPALYARMLPFLRESVLVVDERWEIRANLSAPDGLLGWGDPTGIHTLAYVHPDDVLRFADTGTGLRETDPGWSGSARVRLRKADETYGYYEITMHNRTDDPVLHGMVIHTREVGPPVASAPEFEGSGMVASLADQLPIGVVLVSDSGKPLYVNDAACALLGTTRDQFVAAGLSGLIHEVDRLRVGAILRRLRGRPGRESITVLAGPAGDRRMEVTFVSQTGSELTAEGSEAVLLVMVTIEDVTHRIEREEHLEQRANQDELTGLNNRAWLLDHLHARLTEGADVTVAYVDLVGFKAVNDERGHTAGDEVLRAVAQGVAEGVDPTAEAARVGGDEFVVIQEHVVDGGEDRLAEQIRTAVASAATGVDVAITASVGVVRSRPGDEPWDVLDRADAAMYADKRGERPPG